MFGWFRLGMAWWMLGTAAAFAQMSESFEFGVPPPGWTKTNLLGGSGWYQMPIGVMPLPGWGNGTSSVPVTANAGTHNAYCSWTTGGGATEGYHNDQWLISPRLTGLTATSTVSYWLRFNFTNFPDTVYFRVSTNGPAPANFTIVPLTNRFAKASYTNQFPPWSNHVVNVGALGIPAGTPIWIAIQEYEWDNTWNGAAVQLDVINSDLTAPPEARVGPTSLVFTAYYEGSDPAPQTFTLQGIGSSGMGYSSGVSFGAGPTSWLSVSGPANGTLGFQGSQVYTASVSVAGLDLGTYTATNYFTVPGATNSPLRVPITLNVIRRPQTISFPNPGPQYTTNQVGLRGTSSSGLPVTFSIFSGPGSIVGATNLSFTGTGTVRVVAWQLGNIYYDVAPCVTQAMAVTKPGAVITITNLSHVYDGAPHGATVTTVPPGLTVDTTYNGSASLPVAIGSYAVTSTVNDAIYGGTTTAVFTITRMVQAVDFPDPGAQWTTSVVGLAATASSGLPVTFSVESGPGTISGGTNLGFTGAGTVSVVAAQAGDADWLPAAATNAITVSKVAATVTLASLAQTYDGTAKSAAATTDPAGLAVDFTYDGSGTAPANAGSYAVTGTVNDAIYHGAETGTLVIAKGAAAVTLTNLVQAYDGTPRNAAATTVPAGLAVDFTYDGSTNPPVARGTFAVTGTVHDANWAGSATGTLTVGMGAATVTLESLAQAYDGTPKPATAATVPAGLAVDFTYDGATNPPIEVGSYAVAGTVNDPDWAGSSTGTLVIGKGAATIIWSNLVQVYDGSPKGAAVATVPTGLVVEITYDGSPAAPSAIGSYAVTGVVNDANWQATNTATLTIGKAAATVTLTNLLHTYDGTAQGAAAATDPAGLMVDLTYNGSATVPVDAGSYAVTGTVNDADWQGEATGTLIIAKADATVDLVGLLHAYDGTPKSASATTFPAGLTVEFTYDGSPTLPAAAGSYAVTGTVNDVNWQGSAAGTLSIGKAVAGVYLDSLAHIYDASAKTATATTFPAGLAVDFTYDGSPTPPAAAGNYAVTGTVNDANYQGLATGTLAIAKGAAALTLEDLSQTYNGSPRTVTATTVPAGLAVDFTYDGAAAAPSAAGAYAVTGTVNDANWSGSATGQLVVGKALATVTLANLVQYADGTPKPATALTVPAGLTVDITYDGLSAPPSALGSYAVTGTVNDANYEGAASGTLRIEPATAALGDRVWLDANRNGVQDAGESGIPNIRLELSSNGTVIAATMTDLQGDYRFAGLPPGEYMVAVDVASLPPALAANPTSDPDDPAVPRDHRAAVTLAAGASVATADFGYNWSAADAPLGAIGDRIWVDADRDGRQDPGEPGLAGVTLGLFADTAGNGAYTAQVAAATSDAAGHYIFAGLAAGAYVVRVATDSLPPGFVQTGDPDAFAAALPPDGGDHQTLPLVLAPGGVFVNADFGYAFTAHSTLGDRIYVDLDADGTQDPAEPGIPGVTVVLLDAADRVCASTATADDGSYRFAGLAAGAFTVWVSDSGNCLSRRVQTAGPAGVPGLRSTVLMDGANADLAQDFGFAPAGHAPGLGLIGDTVFLDRDGDGGAPLPGEGLQGVTVDLYDYTGLFRLATTATDANGHYYFGGLEEETYQVVVDTNTLPAGGAGLVNTVDPDSVRPGDSRAILAVGAGAIQIGRNFGYVAAVPNTIGGILWQDDNANGALDAEEAGRFAGVQIVLHLEDGRIAGSTFTGADGAYSFTGLPDGAYGLEIADPDQVLLGYSGNTGFTRRRLRPAALGVAVGGGEVLDTAGFGYHLAQAGLGDFVWYDINGNGLQEAGEPGLFGVQVSLRVEYPGAPPFDLQTFTSIGGLYRFANLLLDPRYPESATGAPAVSGRPRFTVSVDILQPRLDNEHFVTVPSDAGDGTNDSRNPAGAVAVVRQGLLSTGYDFGFDGGPLLAVIGDAAAFTRAGQTIVRWETIESWGTAGFWLERQAGDSWRRVNAELLPQPLFATTPVVYEQADPAAAAGGTYVYRLVELEQDGRERLHGPYTLTVDGPGRTYTDWAAVQFGADAAAAQAGRAADPDGDGLANEQEFWAWTDPNRADSVLRISAVRRGPDGLEVEWQGVPGRVYKLAVAESLAGPFQPLAQEYLATADTLRAAVPAAAGRQLYFQVILVGAAAAP